MMQKNNTFLQKHISFILEVYIQDPHLFLMFSEGEVMSPYFSQLWWASAAETLLKIITRPCTKVLKTVFLLPFSFKLPSFLSFGKKWQRFWKSFRKKLHNCTKYWIWSKCTWNIIKWTSVRTRIYIICQCN